MYRWLLAVTAFALGAALFIRTAPESAALQQTMHPHFPERSATDGPHENGGQTSHPRIQTNAAEAPDSFEAQIESWIRTLAEQREFESWRDARWTRHPLGPGMHGWIVLIVKDGQEIGYLVVAATEDGRLKLTEYGVGDKPLFSLRTLYQSLMQLELIAVHTDFARWLQMNPAPAERVYFSPLHAVWKVAAGGAWIYIDAKTGEQLPLSDESFASLRATTAGIPAVPGGTVRRTLHLRPFDPFERTHWIRGEPIQAVTPDDLVEMLDGSETITFAANLYGKTVLAPFAVTGYHEWSDRQQFVTLEQEGARYIPFGVLAEFGGFYE